jgi:hypothetical protein
MNFERLELTKLVELTCKEIVMSLRSGNHGSVPFIVGAGISFSAGVPLSKELSDKLSSYFFYDDVPNSSSPNYNEVLSKIYSDCVGPSSDDKHFFGKSKFARLLNKSGVPSIDDRPLPNPSNLILYNLLSAGIIGPVVSLNVDPLLDSASLFASNTQKRPVFVHNLSQFSSLNDDQSSSCIVFQPHGTINEPYSLRFSTDELLTKSLGLTRTILRSIGEDSSAVVIVGANLSDGVIFELLSGMALQCKQYKLKIILPLHSSDLSESTKEMIKSRICDHNNDQIVVYYATGIDSDEYFSSLRKKLQERQNTFRGSGKPSPLILSSYAETEFRSYIYHNCIGDNSWDLNEKVKTMPMLMKTIYIDVFVFCLAARGPFTLKALIEWLSSKSYLSDKIRNGLSSDAFGYAREALVRLEQEDVIKSVPVLKDDRFGGVPAATFESIKHKLYARGQIFESEFCGERLLEVLTELLGIDPDEYITKEHERQIKNLFSRIEMDREGLFDQSDSYHLAIHYSDCKIFSSHQELDEELEREKEKFGKWVANNLPCRCKIMTETGDHLFLEDAFTNHYNSNIPLNHNDVRSALRGWMHSIFDADKEFKSSLTIIVSKHDRSLPLPFGERKQYERLLDAALRILDTRPRINVYFCPWTKHEDHMFFLGRQSRRNPYLKAIAFPRPHGETKFSGLMTKSTISCTEIEALFDVNLLRYATPIALDKPLRSVLAITVVDSSRDSFNGVTDDTQILLGVRSSTSNRTHKNIASVPTKRIPESIAWEIVKGAELDILHNTFEAVLQYPSSESCDSKHENTLIDQVHYIFGTKLGLWDRIERDEIHYTAKPVILKSGPSPVLSDDDENERLLMVNVLVELKKGVGYIPQHTASYSRIAWVNAKEFLKAMDEMRDDGKAKISFPGGEEVEYECGGLCVCTSRLLLQHDQTAESNSSQ